MCQKSSLQKNFANFLTTNECSSSKVAVLVLCAFDRFACLADRAALLVDRTPAQQLNLTDHTTIDQSRMSSPVLSGDALAQHVQTAAASP